jgi:serine protein kinase
MFGVSPRYVQDRIAAALVSDDGPPCLTAYDVLDSLEQGLVNHPLLECDELRASYTDVVALVREEMDERLKDEVRQAVACDAEAVRRLCCNYVDGVTTSTRGEGGDERLMRSIEEKIGVTEARKADFRREIVNYIEALTEKGERFAHTSNSRLQAALELKLFEDCRDTFTLTAGAGSVVDRDVDEKVRLVTGHLVRELGYCERCAGRALQRVAGLFARGDTKTPDAEDEDAEA